MVKDNKLLVPAIIIAIAIVVGASMIVSSNNKLAEQNKIEAEQRKKDAQKIIREVEQGRCRTRGCLRPLGHAGGCSSPRGRL